MWHDLISTGISIAAIVAGTGEIRPTKKRGLGVVVHDYSATSTVKTLEEKCVLVATEI